MYEPVNAAIWNVNPELIRLGPLAIRWYGLLFASGFYLGILFFQHVFRRENRSMEDLGILFNYMVAGTVLGARLGHCFFYEPAWYLAHPAEIIMIWRGGLASHGGVIGILIALYFYCRKRPDQNYLWVLDRIVIPTILTGAMIRIGNFFNSEILGVPTDLPWAVTFSQVDMLPRHPAQLYESLSYFCIWLLLFLLYRRWGEKTPPGGLLGLFFILVFGARFFIEFIKERHTDLTADLPLSMGQMLSIPLVIAGIVLLVRALRKTEHS